MLLRTQDVLDQLRATAGNDPWRRPHMQFYYLHHVFPNEMQPFRAWIAELKSRYEVLSHSQAISRLRCDSPNRPLASISFDDGMLNTLEAGELLAREGISACYFVCPDIVDRASDHRFIAEWCRSRLNRNAAPVMSWDQVERLLDMGHEVGNHTATHSNVARLTAEQLLSEISGGREKLIARLGACAGRHFAWPYGELRHATPDALRVVFDSGHESCASAVRGVHVSPLSTRCEPWLYRDIVALHGLPCANRVFTRRSIRRSGPQVEGRS